MNLSEFKSIVFFTGAGISVPSGIRPFRGENGIWNEIDVEKVGKYNSFQKYPKEAFDFWRLVQNQIYERKPNSIHYLIAGLESEHQVTVITQNIDGYHQLAGSKSVLELHGTMREARCSNWDCNLQPFALKEKITEMVFCPSCGKPLRPNAIQFGENLNPEVIAAARKAVKESDLFIAIGTSGIVYPAAGLAELAFSSYSQTVLIDSSTEQPEEFKDCFLDIHTGKAEDVLPVLFHQ